MSVKSLVMMAILGLVAGCGARKAAPAESPRWIRITRPISQDGPETYGLSGTVVPPGSAQSLAFPGPGRVVRVGPREGERVVKGQVLATQETTAYSASLAAASAQTRSAEAAAARAQDELRRMAVIHDRQSLAENDYLKFELADQAAREQVLQAKATESIARKALWDATLRAPASGVITRRLVEPGVLAGAGQPAFEIAQMDPVEVQIGIPENLVGAMRLGQHARVTLPAIPGERFEGTLRVINAAADPASRTYMARITLRNPKGVLRIGMVAEARIQGDRRERMLLAPVEAIVKDPQGAPILFEFRPGENRVVARRVTLGVLDGKLIQVKAGIDPMAQIVIAGQNGLRDGSSVAVEPADPGAPRGGF